MLFSLFTCSAVVTAFISLSNHIPQPCILTIIMFLLSQKYSFTSGTCNSCSSKHHIAYLPFSVGKVPSYFYFLLTFPFFFPLSSYPPSSSSPLCSAHLVFFYTLSHLILLYSFPTLLSLFPLSL